MSKLLRAARKMATKIRVCLSFRADWRAVRYYGSLATTNFAPSQGPAYQFGWIKSRILKVVFSGLICGRPDSTGLTVQPRGNLVSCALGFVLLSMLTSRSSNMDLQHKRSSVPTGRRSQRPNCYRELCCITMSANRFVRAASFLGSLRMSDRFEMIVVRLLEEAH